MYQVREDETTTKERLLRKFSKPIHPLRFLYMKLKRPTRAGGGQLPSEGFKGVLVQQKTIKINSKYHPKAQKTPKFHSV